MGIELQELGNMTRAEIGLMYCELKKREIRHAAQNALSLLPLLQATGLLSIGGKKAVGKANGTFRKLQRELGTIAYG